MTDQSYLRSLRLETAEENIRAAVELLEGIDRIRKASGSVRKNADAIDKESNTVQSGVERHLGAALDALSGVALEAIETDFDAAGQSAAVHGAA